MIRPLTQQQQKVYDFIREKIVDRGYGPTVREIGEHMGIKSPNGVMCHLRALQQKGVIQRKKNKSRAIELTEPVHRAPTVHLPMAGIVSRTLCHLGNSPNQQLDLSGLIRGEGRVVLRVQDDSLLDLHICQGDILVVQLQSEVLSGQLAIVNLLGPEETTVQVLSRVQKVDGQIHLHATNRALPTTTVERVDAVGVVVGVVRSFGEGQI
ncbi:MAG: transcriptional repressor LexA [Planctomycetota bacterium]